MKWYQGCCLLLSGVLALSLTACGQAAAPSETTETTATQIVVTTATILNENLSAKLTTAEISEAVGVEMGDATVSGQGTILTSIAKEGKTVLSVEVTEKPLDIYNTMLQSMGKLTPCPNLGESAWFSNVYNQLYAYNDGYIVMVELTGTDDDQEMLLIRCRQIAALLLQRL